MKALPQEDGKKGVSRQPITKITIRSLRENWYYVNMTIRMIVIYSLSFGQVEKSTVTLQGETTFFCYY